jgi:hypothetical protein
MNRWRKLVVVSCLGLLAALLAPPAQADQWNKKTILTTREPLAIPGHILQPGQYILRLADSVADRSIVQVYEGGKQRLVATIIATPNYRLEPTADTQFSFWEMPAGQPPALRAWFYPGDNFGREFEYPAGMAVQIAQTNPQPPPTPAMTAAAPAPEPEPQPMAAPEPRMEARNEPPAPAPAPAPEAAPTPSLDAAPAPAPDLAPARPVMPRTASGYPLVGLIGLLSLAGAGATRLLLRRNA